MSERARRRTIVTVLLVAVMFMTLAFSQMSSELVIKGTGVINSTFKVFISEAYAIEYKTGVNQSLSYNDVSLTFRVGLVKPGDSVDYIFKVKNEGSIDAFLKEVDDSKMVDSDYIKWNLVKLDEGNIETLNFVDDDLKSGDFHMFKLTVYFDENIKTPPTNPLSVGMELVFDYTQ